MGKAGAVLAIESRSVRSSIAAILIGMAALVGLGVSGAAHAAKIGHRTLSNGVDVILIMGAIERGDDEVFRALSIQHKEAIVVLESDGGALAAAIEIGKIVRLAGYSTLVMEDDVCASSCALIWLAGSPRALSSKGRVGFHASYRDKDGKMEETGVGNALVGHYLTLLNLPQRAIIFATMASPDKISWLSSENRADAGIEFEDFEAGERNEASRRKADATRNRRADKYEGPPPPIVVTNVRPPNTSPSATGVSKPESRPSVAQMSASFRKYLLKPENIRSQFAATGLGEKDFKVFEFHMLEMSKNENFILEFSKEIYNAWDAMPDYESGRRVGGKVGSAISERAFFRGLLKLSNEEIREFFRYFSLYPGIMTESQCHAFFAGGSNDAGLEFRSISAIGTGELEKYLRLYRRGFEAGFSDERAENFPTAEQVDIANKAFKGLFLERVAALTDIDGKRISNAIGDPKTASQKDFCDSQEVIFRAIYDMEGLVGNWFRRDYIRNINRN